MSSEVKSGLILLAKYPEAGNVKTRLAGEIGEEKAAQYYREWLGNNLSAAAKLLSVDIFLRPASTGDLDKMGQLLEQMQLTQRIRLMQPTAGDITGNLKDAFLELFTNRYKKVASAATDTVLKTSFFQNLFKALDSRDIVIGVDQRNEGINAFGVLRSRVVSKRLIRRLFNPNTQGMNPCQWTMHVACDRKSPLRVELITQVFDIDTESDLRA